MEFFILILASLYFALPAFFANMAPIVFKNFFKFLAKPVDLGKKFRGKRILGDNKTFRGFFVGILIGILVAYIQYIINFPINITNYSNWLLIGFLLSFGALFGDSFESFIKRQKGIKPGERFFLWDQIDSVMGALVLAGFLIFPEVRFHAVLILLVLTPILTIIINHLAFYTGLRKEKW